MRKSVVHAITRNLVDVGSYFGSIVEGQDPGGGGGVEGQGYQGVGKGMQLLGKLGATGG